MVVAVHWNHQRCWRGGDEFRKGIKTALSRLPSQHPRAQAISVSSSVTQILRNATALIGIRRDKLVDVDHLIWSTVQDPEIGGLLRYANTKNINYIKELVGLEPKPVEDTDSIEVEYTISLISLAKKGMMDPVIGRDEEIRHLITILLHRTRNNSILVGKRGVRKTSIVKELARHIIARDVLAILADWRILSLDSGSLSSGFVSRDKLKSEPVRFWKRSKTPRWWLVFLSMIFIFQRGQKKEEDPGISVISSNRYLPKGNSTIA